MSTTSTTTITSSSTMTNAELLEQVNAAISKVLIGGQSYQIGSRELTRADLATLRDIQKELIAEENSDSSSSLLDDTYVAFFTGR
ncbi:MAG: peptidylprolyl isomerase [Lachnospiraceae bacterium]|nr:peptidylprolyl isomerase [Lachnospiraceae bacterium]